MSDMAIDAWTYRHDEIVTGRPYGVDVDADGWAWEGCGANRLTGHHLDTAEVRVLRVPEMGGRPVYDVFAWDGRLVVTLGVCPFYLVVDPAREQVRRVRVPIDEPIIWYGARAREAGKLLLFERRHGRVLVLDGPEAAPRVAACPFPGEISSGSAGGDGLVYSAMTDPARLARFDPVAERFVDVLPLPWPEATLSGRFEHGGVLYCADSARGRLLPLRLDGARWLDPVPTPDHGTVYGFLGAAFGCGGRGHFCLSTWAHPSRLDPKTGKVVIPEGPLTVDGRPSRFLDRFLVFDAESRSFDYLVAPEQPDGVPLLCYSWTDECRFLITGIVIPFAEPGEPGQQLGPWLVLQSHEAARVPGLGVHDVAWDRAAHVRRYRRAYPAHRSLYLPERRWSPPTVNMEGPATQYAPGRDAELQRRAERTDGRRYWEDLAATVTAGAATPAEQVRAVLAFVQRALYYNPIQSSQATDPIAVLEAHDGRCGHGTAITRALLEAADVESRSVPLNHHAVAEARYDGAWHLADALFFGADQPARDGVVLSVDQLRADPCFADAFPQRCFAYDPELLLSEDGYQVLGYCFGPWGSEPYYSYYLFGEKDHPPTLPVVLPAQRLDAGRVRLRWSESARLGGGAVEYEVRVCADRRGTQVVFRQTTSDTHLPLDVPEANRMYFVEVRAMDDHRRLNSDTWYPSARGNFVLVPPEQYGWYGVL